MVSCRSVYCVKKPAPKYFKVLEPRVIKHQIAFFDVVINYFLMQKFVETMCKSETFILQL